MTPPAPAALGVVGGWSLGQRTPLAGPLQVRRRQRQAGVMTCTVVGGTGVQLPAPLHRMSVILCPLMIGGTNKVPLAILLLISSSQQGGGQRGTAAGRRHRAIAPGLGRCLPRPLASGTWGFRARPRPPRACNDSIRMMTKRMMTNWMTPG